MADSPACGVLWTDRWPGASAMLTEDQDLRGLFNPMIPQLSQDNALLREQLNDAHVRLQRLEEEKSQRPDERAFDLANTVCQSSVVVLQSYDRRAELPELPKCPSPLVPDLSPVSAMVEQELEVERPARQAGVERDAAAPADQAAEQREAFRAASAAARQPETLGAASWPAGSACEAEWAARLAEVGRSAVALADRAAEQLEALRSASAAGAVAAQAGAASPPCRRSPRSACAAEWPEGPARPSEVGRGAVRAAEHHEAAGAASTAGALGAQPEAPRSFCGRPPGSPLHRRPPGSACEAEWPERPPRPAEAERGA
ncbi:unnamed protein product, partial [Prorocentrum cordatum]